MIPSLISFTKKNVEDTLEALLKRPEYLKKSVLHDIDEEVVQDFISKYCGTTKNGKKQPHTLNIILGYPQDPEKLDGAIVLTQGESVESRPSIGGVEGSYRSFSGNVISETCEITVLPQGDVQVTTTYPPFLIDNVREFTFQDAQVEITGNTIIFKIGDVFSPSFFTSGDVIHVTYEEKIPEELYGLAIGYTATEQINMSSFSFNYATMLCLSSIMKAIIILTRQTLEGQMLYSINTVQFSSIAPVDSDIIPETNPNILFTQDVVTQCEVSYAIDKGTTSNIEEITLRGHFGK